MTTRAALDALIEELTVDAYDDEEQLSGFLVGAQEALVPGEPGTIVGVDVNVVTVDCGPDARTGLTARVQRDGATYERSRRSRACSSERARAGGRSLPALAGPVSARRRAPTALALSTDAERAAVLDALVRDDRELARRAEQAARLRLERVDADDVATTVADALLALDQEELSAHAGRTRYGYVEPTEAAWWLLEQAVEPRLEDITRRATLGLSEAARRLGLGILQGLYGIRDRTGDDGLLLAWAPDFPREVADRVIRVLSDIGIDLTDTDLGRVVPDWA